MTEAKINISELKSEGSDIIKDLTEFLKEKTKAEVDAGVNEITVKGEEKAISRLYLRALLRKFLHRKELKDHFRIIGGKENTLIIKKKKIAEEE
ncbi:hypothetical protein COS86_02085 [Candidatus Bathyarchaeota archaeon CG07_land_8_20_14_0_80_47_9]|nr:MAG: hypothetical protein COS86_02085 [Candidatus Bathyarchaeota archaeon CG07_land_8_20_14_0_80_47_9]